MSRSTWKIKFYKKHNNSNQITRSSTILPSFANKIFKVHSGNSWSEILVSTEMVNCKFGEFVATRQKHVFKKKKEKKNKILV